MSHGLIDPSKLPGLDLDLAGVTQAATEISSRAGSIRQAGTDAASSWSALPSAYESTGAESVYVAMNPVRDASDRVGGDLASVASALSTWATTVQPILSRVADLRTDAEAFVVEANTFQPRVTTTGNLAVTFLPVQVDNWWEDPEMVQRNADLVDQGYLLGEQLRVANEDLANAIRRAAGLSTTTVAGAATTAPDNLQTDWGSASPREESCAEKTIGFPMHLTGGVLTGAWDMVGGLGMLIYGYDFKSWPPPPLGVVGDMQAGNFVGAANHGSAWLSGWVESWIGLGHLVSGVSMGFLAPVKSEIVAPGQIADLKSKGIDTGFLEWEQQWTRDSYRSYIDLLGSFVGYHAPEEWWNASPEQWGEGWSDWEKDPGGNAGTSLFNWATLVVPVKGGGAILDALKGGRAAEGVADDAGRAGAAERSSGAVESNSVHVQSNGLADDAARLGRARDDLANSLERSPLDDGGTLVDDIRGGDHLLRPDEDLHRVHTGDSDVQQFHFGDPDASAVHHGGEGPNPPSPHSGESVPDDGGSRGGSPSAPDATGGRPPVAGTVDRIDGHDIWLPDGFKHEGNYVVRYEEGVPGSRIPAEDYLGLRERSVHNEGSDTLVLGRYVKNDPTSYIAVAERDGARYFDMGPEWGQAEKNYGLSPREDMFNFFNRPVLDEAMQSGMKIRFTHDPLSARGSFLETEAKYLVAHGYRIMPDRNGGFYAER